MTLFPNFFGIIKPKNMVFTCRTMDLINSPQPPTDLPRMMRKPERSLWGWIYHILSRGTPTSSESRTWSAEICFPFRNCILLHTVLEQRNDIDVRWWHLGAHVESLFRPYFRGSSVPRGCYRHSNVYGQPFHCPCAQPWTWRLEREEGRIRWCSPLFYQALIGRSSIRSWGDLSCTVNIMKYFRL